MQSRQTAYKDKRWLKAYDFCRRNSGIAAMVAA